MQRAGSARTVNAETAGLWFGLVGVVAFSITLPATRIAVAYLDPTFVGLGRALVAAVFAAILLIVTHQRRPTRQELGRLVIVVFGVILGFPLLSAWAMRQVPAAHGAIVVGLLPLATALAAAIRVGERPSWQFWLAGLVGSGTVISFAIISGAGKFHIADLALLGAVAAGAMGYAEGGRLARTLGGWQVICWALVLGAPFISIPVAFSISQNLLVAPPHAWMAFAYVALISQFLGFFAWYHGLSLGGVARVSQTQLLQPFFTLIVSALLLHEYISRSTILVALVVMLSVAIGRKAPVIRPAIQH